MDIQSWLTSWYELSKNNTIVPEMFARSQWVTTQHKFESLFRLLWYIIKVYITFTNMSLKKSLNYYKGTW